MQIDPPLDICCGFYHCKIGWSYIFIYIHIYSYIYKYLHTFTYIYIYSRYCNLIVGGWVFYLFIYFMGSSQLVFGCCCFNFFIFHLFFFPNLNLLEVYNINITINNTLRVIEYISTFLLYIINVYYYIYYYI